MTDFKVDKAALDQYDSLLDDAANDESAMQRFLEQHPEFLYTPHLLNHGLHDEAIITQFRLTTALTTDFAYLTKSSNVWRLVLVEIEPPSVQIFTSATPVQVSAEFSKRKAQLDSWRYAVETNSREILRPLDPMRQPMHDNVVEFYYVLICGRSLNPERSDPKVRHAMNTIGGEKCQVLTYDALRRAYTSGRNEYKNVLAIRKDQFHFKELLTEPSSMFAFMSPHELVLTKDQETTLKMWGYEIDDWYAGKLLRYNNKFASFEALQRSR